MCNADLEVTRFRITPGHMGTRRCQSKMAIERDLGQSGRTASVDPTRATARAHKQPIGSTPKLARVKQPRTTVVNPASGSSLDRNEEQGPCLQGSSLEQDKAEDGFAHPAGKTPRKEPLFGVAPQKMETGSDFTIGLISSPRWEQDPERQRRPSNDRVPGNKTER